MTMEVDILFYTSNGLSLQMLAEGRATGCTPVNLPHAEKNVKQETNLLYD